MTVSTVDVKILAAPGAALDQTAKHVWSAAGKVHCRVAVEQLQVHRDWALFGSPSLPAVVVNGRIVHEGSVPSAAAIKAQLHA